MAPTNEIASLRPFPFLILMPWPFQGLMLLQKQMNFFEWLNLRQSLLQSMNLGLTTEWASFARRKEMDCPLTSNPNLLNSHLPRIPSIRSSFFAGFKHKEIAAYVKLSKDNSPIKDETYSPINLLKDRLLKIGSVQERLV